MVVGLILSRHLIEHLMLSDMKLGELCLSYSRELVEREAEKEMRKWMWSSINGENGGFGLGRSCIRVIDRKRREERAQAKSGRVERGRESFETFRDLGGWVSSTSTLTPRATTEMGLLTIIRKTRLKEKQIRILMLFSLSPSLSLHSLLS